MEINIIEKFLREFISTWQVAKIYGIEHPRFLSSLDVVFDNLEPILIAKKELIIGVVGSEFACGEDIFFELSQKSGLAIAQLKEKGIERIIFQKGVDKEEVSQFISLLVVPQTQIEGEFKDYLSVIGIKNIRVGKIIESDLGPVDKDGSNFDKIDKYKDCLDKVSKSLDSLIDEDKVDFLKVKFVTNAIMDNLSDSYQIFLSLSEVKNYDSATFVHLLNVSVLSIYFSHKLGLGRDDCLDIGVSALLHDIGKLSISRKIIQKSGKLKDEEFTKIKSHTILGAEILLHHSDKLGVLPAIVAFEHHLGWDSKGYPKISFSRRPHLASSIVHICDEYDALTQRRSYKRDYPPEIVYQIMNKQKGAKFSPKLLDKFFKILGLWPKGSIVRLSDSRIAVVRQPNEEDIYRPQVEIVSDSAGEMVDLSSNPEIGIRHALNPLTEGKQYLRFI
ncbi:MAG: HD domain-containing protein [Candidatus Omnitrophica bacterium]|nr:HD domain-containing protein [Candidatus Omnitrophota bacterium]